MSDKVEPLEAQRMLMTVLDCTSMWEILAGGPTFQLELTLVEGILSGRLVELGSLLVA